MLLIFAQNQENMKGEWSAKVTEFNIKKVENCTGVITGVSEREYRIDIERRKKQEKDCGDLY